jgi:hypothetical protein
LLSDTEFNLAEFGEPEGHFRVGGKHYQTLKLVVVLGTILGLGTFGVVAFIESRNPLGPNWLVLGVIGTVAVSVAVAAVAATIRILRYRGLEVLVCKNALVCMNPNSVQAVRWNEITGIRRVTLTSDETWGSLKPARQVIIDYGGKEPLIFDEMLENLSRVRDLVEQHTFDHLLASALEKLREGESVQFGPLSISQEGVRSGKSVLPWTDYGGVQADPQLVVMHYKGRDKPFCKLKTAEVPNIHVLPALADFFGKSVEEESDAV